MILENYKRFLKMCNFDMQIIIQTDNIEIDKHLENIAELNQNNDELSNMINDYIYMLKDIAKKRDCISRKFYIAIPSKAENVKEKIFTYLEDCRKRSYFVFKGGSYYCFKKIL